MVSLGRRICSFQCFSKSMKRRRRRRRRRGDNLVAKVIPFDIQIEILTRLPPTSLCRFKCVSKLWFSLIRSRWFSNRYLTVASPSGPPSRYVSLVDHHCCDSMESCHKPGKSALLTLSNYSCNSGLVMPGIGGHRMVVLRGLILYNLCYKACIYNPATRQSLTLPPVQSNLFAQEEGKKDVFYYLGHDPVLDQYKVLCTVLLSKEVDDDDDDDNEYMTSEHWVFLLEARGSWKRLVFDNHDHCPTRLGMCINGVIHYLAVTPTSRDNLVSFDVRSEEFSMIQAPDEVGESVGFIEYDGKPTIVDHTHIIQTGLVNLWVFQGTTWPKKLVLVLETCKMQLFDKTTELWVAGTTMKGEVIFVPRGWSLPFYTLYYDLKSNELRKVTIIEREPEYHGVTGHPVYYYTELEDKSENILHLEI